MKFLKISSQIQKVKSLDLSPLIIMNKSFY